MFPPAWRLPVPEDRYQQAARQLVHNVKQSTSAEEIREEVLSNVEIL